MIARITPENEDFVRQQIEAGVFPDRDSVFNAGLVLLRERTELVAHLKEGRRQLDEGEFVDYDESTIGRLFDDLRKRAVVETNEHDSSAAT